MVEWGAIRGASNKQRCCRLLLAGAATDDDDNEGNVLGAVRWKKQKAMRRSVSPLLTLAQTANFLFSREAPKSRP